MTNLALVTQFTTKVGKRIEDFLYEKSKQSKDTATAYRSDIKRFLSDVYDKSINTITAEELEVLDYDSFRGYLNSFLEKQSNSLINRYSSCIKSMYRYLNKTSTIRSDLTFFELVENLPNNPNSYESIPMEVAEQYIEATRFEKNQQIEKKIIIKMAIDLGLRESELRKLEWSQFKPDGERVILKGIGKGNKKYVEVLSRDFYNEILELKKDGCKEIFTLSKKNLTDMMVRLKKNLHHEDRNYTFHSFKKTAVTNTYKLTGSITDAQKKGKHEFLATTQKYLEEEEVKMTGYYSLEGNLNHNLYKEVSHEVLMDTLKGMSKEMLFVLNMKLNSN
jgi:integrase